jgi:hypothetical protein
MKSNPFRASLFLRAFAGLCALTLLVPVVAAAQKVPLAEVARKEAERRKGTKETKVITTKDLPESARRPATPATPAPSGEGAAAAAPGSAPADATGAPASGSSSSSDQKDEKYWRGRITGAREALRRHESFALALQTRINSLTSDSMSRDDPIQRTKLRDDRDKAVEELARVKADVENARKQIDDVEEEARKAGVPPGWLR